MMKFLRSMISVATMDRDANYAADLLSGDHTYGQGNPDAFAAKEGGGKEGGEKDGGKGDWV